MPQSELGFLCVTVSIRRAADRNLPNIRPAEKTTTKFTAEDAEDAEEFLSSRLIHLFLCGKLLLSLRDSKPSAQKSNEHIS